jgi:isocitrate dehydrogenase (NAD+)
MHRVTFIPGDGIGPEVTGAARRCIEATGVQIEWDLQEAGEAVLEEEGTPLPERVLASIRRNRVALKGPITTPVGGGFRSVNVAIRKELDLYANLRPAKFYPGVRTRLRDPEKIDLIVVRENTEDLYAGIEFEQGTPRAADLIRSLGEIASGTVREDSGLSIKPISITATRRIVRFAFERARKKVTAVTKSNILKHTDGLFQQVAEEVAQEYPEIEFEHRLVDNMCMQLVRKPEEYDVLVLPNLYGDIVSDLCAGLVGGLGVAPGANIGEVCAVFEAVHGSAPKYAGQDKVNPSALILSGGLLLRHLGEAEAAERLERALAKVIAEGKRVTYDLASGEPVGTSEMADAVIARL